MTLYTKLKIRYIRWRIMRELAKAELIKQRIADLKGNEHEALSAGSNPFRTMRPFG